METENRMVERKKAYYWECVVYARLDGIKVKVMDRALFDFLLKMEKLQYKVIIVGRSYINVFNPDEAIWNYILD